MHQIKCPLFPANKPDAHLFYNGIQPLALMNQDQVVIFLPVKSEIISSQFRSC